jgi:pimeloyl-ACP methyl ester carboxylesterase
VICLDYLGRRPGGGDQPPGRFTSERLGALVVGVLDQLGIEHAVVGGTSIGSTIALEAALHDGDRVTGLLLEGPFLDNAAYATAFGWSAMFAMLTLGRPALRAVALVLKATGIGRVLPPNPALEDPARATAFLRGLFFGRIGPPREERTTIAAPTLVIGYPIDPFHPMSDARSLVEDLPDARLGRTSSILDLRLRPERLAGQIARFVGDCRRRAQARAVAPHHEAAAA